MAKKYRNDFWNDLITILWIQNQIRLSEKKITFITNNNTKYITFSPVFSPPNRIALLIFVQVLPDAPSVAALMLQAVN